MTDRYPWHEVVFERHHDDVQTNDARAGQVEIFAADERMQNHSRLGVVAPVRRLTQDCNKRTDVKTLEKFFKNV